VPQCSRLTRTNRPTRIRISGPATPRSAPPPTWLRSSTSSKNTPSTTNASTPLDATGTLTVQCTAGSGQGVGLGDGLNYSASRRLQNGTSYLTYELYQDPGRSARWGDAIVGERYTTGFPFATTGLLTLTIYGRVFAGQMVAAGSYTDTVSATVYF